MAEVDSAEAHASCQNFDATGNSARPDVFTLSVDQTSKDPVVFG